MTAPPAASRPWTRRLPVPLWLPGYSREWLSGDVLAGLVLSGLIVPQGLAYAGIAGVPPPNGLYAAAAGLLVYSLFASSRHLVVAPTSSSAALLAAAVVPLAGGDLARYAELASAMAIGVGLLFVLARVVRMGFIADFVAKPVLKGFTFGLALRILVTQVPKLLGVPAGKGGFFAQVGALLSAVPSTHLATLAVGAGALAAMVLVPRLVRHVPPGLVALVLGLLAAALFHLEARGVKVMGSVATGLPDPGVPAVGGGDAEALWGAALGIVLVVFAEALGASRTLGAKHDYDVDANRELLALGAANLASGLFQGIAVGGGLSGSAANDAAGAKTPFATIVTSAVVVLTLLFLLPLFASLPDAVLGAIVVLAVLPLLDVREARRYAGLRYAFIPYLTALLGVLVLGVLGGMVLAVVLTFVLLVHDLARPHIEFLGRVPGQRLVVALAHNPDARPIPGLVILRPEGRLFYGNAEHIREHLLAVARAEPRPRRVLLSLEATPMFGVTVNDMVVRVHAELARRGVEIALTRVHDDVLDYVRRSGLDVLLGADRVNASMTDAVDAYLRDHPDAAPAS